MAKEAATLFLISIHAPRTGSDSRGVVAARAERMISIHAPRTGSDPLDFCPPLTLLLFQSTLPARGATRRGWTS